MNPPNPYAPPKSPVADADEFDETGVVLATRGQRLGAFTLDALIGLIWTLPVLFFLGVWDYAVQSQPIPWPISLLAAALEFILFMLVNGYFLRSSGQTLGKKLVGIRIVTLDNTVPALARVIFLRYAPISVIALIPSVGALLAILVDSLFIFGAPRRCVHDLVAGTKVVRSQQPTAA